MMTAVLLLLALSLESRDTPNLILPGADLYPPAAAAAKLQGDVIAHLAIGSDGSIRCTAEAAEALVPLKRPSCELIVRRDIFPPKIGRGGVLVATQLDLIVRWRLSTDNSRFGGAVPVGRDYWVRHADYPYVGGFNMHGGKVRVGFDVSSTGRVENCRLEHSSSDVTLDGLVCPLLARRAALLPAVDANGEPKRTHGTFTVVWRNTPLSEDFSEEGSE